MLTVRDVFTRLSNGQLRNLNLATGSLTTDAGILADSHAAVLNQLNEALATLYRVYRLQEKSLVLLVFDHRTDYRLDKRNSFTGSGRVYNPSVVDVNGPCIIDDHTNPFLDDVVKVLSVYNQYGNKLPINDLNDPYSIFTPYSELLQIPNSVGVKQVVVEYQATHPKILLDPNREYLEVEIVIPKVLEDAFLYLTASTILSNMNTQESNSKGLEYFQKYQAICVEITAKDLVSESVSFTNSKFEKGGWV